MVKFFLTSVLFLSLIAQVFASGTTDEKTKYLLKYVFKANQTAVYTIDVNLTKPDQPTLFPVVVGFDVNEKTIEAKEDGAGVIETKINNISMSLGVSPMDAPDSDSFPTLTETLSATGKQISFSFSGGSEGYEDYASYLGKSRKLARPIYPTKAIGIGDKWTVKLKDKNSEQAYKTNYEIVALEAQNGINTLKLKVKSEVGGMSADTAVFEGYLWIDPANGQAVKASLQGKNIVTPLLGISNINININQTALEN